MTAQNSAKRGNAIRDIVRQGLMVLPALALLIGLGVWQLHRLAWKEALLASIAAEIHRPPAPLETPPEAWRTLGTEEYRPVSVSGRFHNRDERYLLAVEDGEAGWHVYTPLETEGGRLVFVNRGFVPDALKDPATRTAGELEGPVTVTGLVRAPGVQGTFEPDADPVRNIWYWRDLKGMTASLPSEADRSRVLAFFIDAAAEPANPGGWPKGGVTRIDIPNRHLEYALTWFGLAAALALVFALFAWGRLRRVASGPSPGA